MKLLEKIIIYLSRRDFTLDKIRRYQKYFTWFMITLFTLTMLRVDMIFSDPIFSLTLSVVNIPFLITQIVILSVATLCFYFYNEKYDLIQNKYVRSLCVDNKEVTCAFPDDIIDSKVYKIEKDSGSSFGGFGWRSSYHIHLTNGGIYNFGDHRAFKFVNVKHSRKLKLQKLMSNG